MIKYYTNNAAEKGLKEIESLQKNCWVYLEAPTAEEITSIAAKTSIPEHFLRSALDEEEAAHLDAENNDSVKLIVIDIPTRIHIKEDEDEVFTLPLAIIYSEDYFITVCTKSTTVVNDVLFGKIKNVNVSQKLKLAYQIIYNTAVRFLYYLKQIDKASDRIQKNLSKSMQNEELLQLVSLQKSLVFFSASLTANFAVIQKIANVMNKLPNGDHFKEELEILEDVIIESRQAIEMCSVYREIIKSTMDAFAAVVNNNQNIVMKFLTVITIILSIPMVLSGFWGMNTGVPFEGKPWGFWIAVSISITISLIIYFFMSKKKMM